MDFLDILGASGASYRYRRATLDQLPPTAGNVVAVISEPSKRRFLVCGAARSLNRVRPELEAILQANPSADLFVRLNVARATREAEHADVAAAVQPDAELPDID